MSLQRAVYSSEIKHQNNQKTTDSSEKNHLVNLSLKLYLSFKI